MHYNKLDDILDYLSKSNMRVFSVHDAAKIMRKSSAYASLLLSRSKKVRRLERGRYFIEGATIDQLASNILYPSYISLSAALQHYELIDQNIIRYSVISSKRHVSMKIDGNTVEFITTSKSRIFGYTYETGAFIAVLEKLFVDCLYFNTPGFSQVNASFASALDDYKMDVRKLKDYALKMGSKSLINKIGLLLELNGIDAQELQPYTYRPQYVRVAFGSTGRNKKWMVRYDR